MFVSNTKDEIRLISAPYQQCDDGKMHVITLARNGSRWDWSVDGHHTTYYDTCESEFSILLISSVISHTAFASSANYGACDWYTLGHAQLDSQSGAVCVHPGTFTRGLLPKQKLN